MGDAARQVCGMTQTSLQFKLKQDAYIGIYAWCCDWFIYSNSILRRFIKLSLLME